MMNILAEIPQIRHQNQILLYPAAGFDWKVPLALMRLRRRQPNLPEPGLGIYIDYSAELLTQLEQAASAGDRLFWGPDVYVDKVRAYSPPDALVWRLRSMGQHAPEGGSVTGDQWYILDLKIAKYTFPILYVPADAVAFVSEILAPMALRPSYVATVTDGCRQGGNWCCLSRRESPFFKTLAKENMLPDYWLTDHGNLGYPSAGKIRTGVYGNGESKLLAIQ